MIQTIIFDFGGVIATLDGDEAKKRFSDLGVADVDRVLDPYRQQGFFGDLEEGKIGEEEFRRKLGEMCGRELTFDEVRHCWLGYMKELPFYKLDALKKLRRKGFRVVMLYTAQMSYQHLRLPDMLLQQQALVRIPLMH